jgi:hypothetical protein
LFEPYGLIFGLTGDLLVSTEDRVLRFDGDSGAFLGEFVPSGSGGLLQARGLAFKADGNLLVASFGSGEILEYDGAGGSFIGRFDHGGASTGFWALQQPWGLRVGPNAHVYVSTHQGNTALQMYHGATGLFLRAFYILADDTLAAPRGFDFVYGWSADCNINLLPDSCDIAAGADDLDGDGVPDSCQVDCNSNGVPDRLDLAPFGWSLDVDFNAVPDECQCPADLNHDGVVDAADLARLLAAWGVNPGNAADLTGNGLVNAADLAVLLAAWGPCP